MGWGAEETARERVGIGAANMGQITRVLTHSPFQGRHQRRQHLPIYFNSSSPPMPTIHDLPLETFEHIITIAHPVESDVVAEQIARRHFYLDTSLVCRDWTPFAQRALWKDVHVDRRSIEELVDSGGAGRYPVERLSVDGVYVGASVLGTLLTSVRGVRDLKLEDCIIDASWLAGNNWRGESHSCRSSTLSDPLEYS
jgi:hypothetical protein